MEAGGQHIIQSSTEMCRHAEGLQETVHFPAGWVAQRLARIISCPKALYFPQCPPWCWEALVDILLPWLRWRRCGNPFWQPQAAGLCDI